MSAPIRAAYYGRVSTADQIDGTSLDTQRDRCLAAIEAKDWELAGEFVDEGVSGAKGNRPELDRLMAACHAGEVDAVVVAKLDRFGRSVRHLSRLIGDLDDQGVIFVSVAESFDSSNPAGRLMRNMLGSFAEFERDQIRDRTMAGLIAVAKQGFWPGGPAPYGFRLDKDSDGSGHTRLALDDTEAEMFRVAVTEILAGRTVWATAELLNSLGYKPRSATEWTYHNLRRVLVDAQLSGKWSYGRPYGWGRSRSRGEFTVDIPPIVTEGQHAALREILMGKAIPRSERLGFFLVSRGVLVSPCGRNMRGKARKDRGTYRYMCPNTEWNTAGTRCECHSIHGQWIDDLVWSEVKRLMSDPEHLVALADDYLDRRVEMAATPENAADIDRKIAELERARTTTATGYLKAGLDPALVVDAVAELDSELAAWQRRAEQAQAWSQETEATKGRLQHLTEMAQRASLRLDSLSRKEQRVVIEALELKVHVLGWDPCTLCGGTGKFKGGKGGTSCTACHMVKEVPRLRIDGIWSSALDGDNVGHSVRGVDAPHTGALVRFDNANWSGFAGATRPEG